MNVTPAAYSIPSLLIPAALVTSLNVPFFSLCSSSTRRSRAHGEITATVVVVIAGRAADAVRSRIESGFLRHILELAVSQIVVERHAAFRAVAGKKDVDLAVAIVVEKTRARSQ